MPVLPLDFDTTDRTTAELDKADLIIVTQSCDLANLRVGFWHSVRFTHSADSEEGKTRISKRRGNGNRSGKGE